MANERLITRREQRIAARKAQILDAAATVFSRKGYKQATTREIADIADLSEGTLYNYFNSKHDLLIGLVQDFVNEMVENIISIQAKNIEEMLSQLLVSQFQHAQKYRMLTLILHEARLDPEIHHCYMEMGILRIRHELERRIQTIITTGTIRPVNSPAITAQILIGLMTGRKIFSHPAFFNASICSVKF